MAAKSLAELQKTAGPLLLASGTGAQAPLESLYGPKQTTVLFLLRRFG